MIRRSCLLSLCLAVCWSADADLRPVQMTQHKVKAATVQYKGRSAVQITDGVADSNQPNEDRLAILPGIDFGDGVIEAMVAGEPGPGAAAAARGFVGIAFRVAKDFSKFDCFYLRPTNGRADDQVRRNHSVQYISFPDFPWPKLRKETPEKYESYVDLVPGEWTKIKIEVRGEKARLFVHDAQQPTLVVNDVKTGSGARGSVALWIGPGTIAHFADVRVTQ